MTLVQRWSSLVDQVDNVVPHEKIVERNSIVVSSSRRSRPASKLLPKHSQAGSLAVEKIQESVLCMPVPFILHAVNRTRI